MNSEQYQLHLQTHGFLNPPSTVDALPNTVFEKIEQVNLGVSEMKDELANIKLGIDEMNNKEGRICPMHVIVFVVVMLIVAFLLKK
jgi:hypothetical protein